MKIRKLLIFFCLLVSTSVFAKGEHGRVCGKVTRIESMGVYKTADPSAKVQTKIEIEVEGYERKKIKIDRMWDAKVALSAYEANKEIAVFVRERSESFDDGFGVITGDDISIDCLGAKNR